jgi:hypothetical protein
MVLSSLLADNPNGSQNPTGGVTPTSRHPDNAVVDFVADVVCEAGAKAALEHPTKN